MWKSSKSQLAICSILATAGLIYFTSPHTDPEISITIQRILTGEPVILQQDDPRILRYIRENGLVEPPVPSKVPYVLKDTREDPSRGQAQFIRRLLGNMTNGFFVECGALDGETRSNTLFLELELGWKGLLIEADPLNYGLVKRKQRKAWTSNTCLSIKPYPHRVKFVPNFNVGKILEGDSGGNSRKQKTVEVQCIPLYSLLAAIDVKVVDYFSLDVEGSELKVLKTIPFDKVLIKTLSVEFIHTDEGRDSLLDFMESKGYEMVGEVRYPGDLANDFMFAHKSLMDHTEVYTTG